ncbi:MAG: toxin-antitoxin system HicB family antitoxin [Eubacterium sp.]|nr:toxin-antitoxin system HicB family antitoxin [Eubacterium sp.]
MCEPEGIVPKVAYKGSFNVRISPELHRKAVITAAALQMSLNSFVENSIEKAVGANA